MILTWDRRRRPRWRRASFGPGRTRRRKPPSPGRPSRPCAGRDRNWDRVSTSCALLLLGLCPFEQPSPRMRPQPQDIFTGLEADLKPNGRYRGAEKLRCGDLPPRPKRRRTLAAPMSLRRECPSRPVEKNQLLFWRAHIRGEHRHAPHIAVADKHPAEASAGLFAGHLAGADQSIITRSPNGVAGCAGVVRRDRFLGPTRFHTAGERLFDRLASFDHGTGGS